MGKWCLHASWFIFDWIIIKVAGNQDRHKSSVKFDFGPNQTTHFGVTCPWVTKISHFWTWISLKPVGQSWSNFMCSIIGVGERLHRVLGQIGSLRWAIVALWATCSLLFLIGSFWYFHVTTSIKAWMSSNFRQIRLLTTELAALERLKHQCLHVFSVGIDPILVKVGGYIDMHNILHEFEFWPNGTTDYGVSCPWASKKLISPRFLSCYWSDPL